MQNVSTKWFFVVCENFGGGYETSIFPEHYLKNLLKQVFSVELEPLSVSAYMKAEALATEKIGNDFKK